MKDFYKFLFCMDHVGEDGLEFILHTQTPRVLFRVLRGPDDDPMTITYPFDPESFEIEVAQEYDKLADFTSQQFTDLIAAVKRWYIYYRRSSDDEHLFEGKTAPREFYWVDLDDAYITNVLNNDNYQIPSSEELDMVRGRDYVMVSKMGEKFWCAVWFADPTEKIYYTSIDQDPLLTPLHELKEDDAIIIEHRHVFEIRKGDDILY